jgi:hypothetical protein
MLETLWFLLQRLLPIFENGRTNQLGYGESMHVAIENDDYSLFKFLIYHGDFASYSSNHIGNTALEQAAMLPDQRYFIELLTRVVDLVQSRFLTAVVHPENVCLNDNQRAAILKHIEQLR